MSSVLSDTGSKDYFVHSVLLIAFSPRKFVCSSGIDLESFPKQTELDFFLNYI